MFLGVIQAVKYGSFLENLIYESIGVGTPNILKIFII